MPSTMWHVLRSVNVVVFHISKYVQAIKKYIKGAVASGALVQTKGKGASGSFKLASKEKVEKVAAKPKAAAAANGSLSRALHDSWFKDKGRSNGKMPGFGSDNENTLTGEHNSKLTITTELSSYSFISTPAPVRKM
ncbi:histone H1-like [Frankliniella occidentalis]|uniref:Histone H1-like n=1 Tax=Frankliniella occidentalis TaxID=133901 RepID=A0A6J1T8A9_FRAOC|nr:histone H1-like [Frankliniella occidentalis]